MSIGPLMLDDVIFDLKSWQPALLSGTQGTSPADLDKLEKVARQSLPEVYRKFMSVFGKSSGGLKFRGAHGYYDMTLEAVLRKPMRPRSGPKQTPTPLETGEWLLIGTSEGGCQDCGPLYLHNDPKTPVVAQSESLRELIILAPCLEAFLFNNVLRETKTALFKAPLHIVNPGPPEEVPAWQDRFRQWLTELGFVSHVRWEGAAGYELWLRTDALAAFFRDRNKVTHVGNGDGNPILAIYAPSPGIIKQFMFTLKQTHIPHSLQPGFPPFPPRRHLVFE